MSSPTAQTDLSIQPNALSAMIPQHETIEYILVLCLNPVFLTITDKSQGCGEVYESILVSDRFQGLPTPQRHSLVFKLLGRSVVSRIKSFSVTCYTSAEWDESDRPGEGKDLKLE